MGEGVWHACNPRCLMHDVIVPVLVPILFMVFIVYMEYYRVTLCCECKETSGMVVDHVILIGI